MKLSICLNIGLYLRDDGAVHLGPHELVLLLDLLDHLLLETGEVACLQDQLEAFIALS